MSALGLAGIAGGAAAGFLVAGPIGALLGGVLGLIVVEGSPSTPSTTPKTGGDTSPLVGPAGPPEWALPPSEDAFTDPDGNLWWLWEVAKIEAPEPEQPWTAFTVGRSPELYLFPYWHASKDAAIKAILKKQYKVGVS